MIIPAIRKITIFYNDGAFAVYNHGQDGITEILDKSLKFKFSVSHIFYIMKGDSVYIKLINVSVVVEYFN